MRWDHFTATPDFRPIMWTRELVRPLGLRIELHKFVGTDDPGCFHTHSSHALRVILRGGYVEELEGGRLVAWRAGDVGLVKPSTSHRVHVLLYGRPAVTLWIRGPKVAEVKLRGQGWPQGTPWTCQRCGARGIAKQLLDGEACPNCGLVL